MEQPDRTAEQEVRHRGGAAAVLGSSVAVDMLHIGWNSWVPRNDMWHGVMCQVAMVALVLPQNIKKAMARSL